MSVPLDKRLHAYRDDLADEALKGKVNAAKFIRGERHRIEAHITDLRPAPDEALGIDSQLIMGDPIRVFDRKDDWAWVQSLRDNYVGYVREEVIGPKALTLPPTTHRVCTPRTFTYSQPDMKTPMADCLTIGSALTIVGETETRGTKYVETSDGKFLIARHVSPIDDYVTDYVDVAEMLLHAPYLWGGATAFGIDCSGLVQLSMLMAGKKVQRDSDMQEESVGTPLGFAAMNGGLQRGDLIFWKGHVGIMRDEDTLIHANGHTMSVATEKLEDAIERIGYLYGFPRTLRRP